MKIIHLVLGKANPERMNGVNKVAHKHATTLSQLGFDITLWGITKNPVYDFPGRNYKTILFKPGANLFSLDSSLKMAIKKLDQDTVFHIHGALIPAFFLVTRLLRKKKIPYVYTPHGAFNRIALLKNKWIKKIYISLFEFNILKEAKKVHFLGESEYSEIDNLLPLSNKFLLPNGQDLNELTFQFRQLQPKTAPVFGFCGRLDIYYKALDLQLSAFAEYKREKGTGVFWLIGDGQDRKKLELITEQLNIKNDVRFFGSMYGPEKLNTIANMDIFLHPSRSEGSPTAVLEACGLGIPCIVSTATNIGNQVDEYGCGIHLKTNNRESLTHALLTAESLFYSGELRPMGRKAMEMVQQEFDWKSIAGKLADVYSTSLQS